jgi:nucleoside-triphosphatase THEP1
MKIAYTMIDGPGALDLLLADFAETLKARGVRTRGIVQLNTENGIPHRCDMDVKILPDGPKVRISQYLGRDAKGCRLDPDALETAAAHVAQTMASDFDIFILNKFGKQEAEGRGFRDMIGEALARGASVLVGTNTANEGKFIDFSGGIATAVPPDAEALLNWFFAESVPA